ncbi:phosphatase PAP2/dual specificity phosphatase family protein [Acinetobacter sp. YH12039]|uniref:phosphatase PAP2/dual specificity phosphatase family protein n=1 Tax=Acinetobacter sp. YH12039 TaxID=2601047 RepID=UPI0015D13A56|nr:phosphatase PAP2/dual specificity phosphatase family protein [Acinetobacter sp. YH12039]
MHKLDTEKGTWKYGLLCLAFLAPFFFLSYGFANQYAAGLASVPVIVFEWEKYIPLWPWSIVPYWSIDLFYGLSLLLCWNKFELKQHVLRLFSAQILSISCFLLFPLRFSFERPELTGFFGLWFDVLMGFDKPFNQAPSLHIVLLVILWDFFRRHSTGKLKYLVDGWSFLIGLSVLTTWQHHFIDIPTGLLVGALCLWLFPMASPAPWAQNSQSRLSLKHIKIGILYLFAALLCSAIAHAKGWWLWLLYPASSLLLVSFAYLFNRPHFFQKLSHGDMTIAAKILFAPYFVFAWINSRIWTYRHPEDSKIIKINQSYIYLGRYPSKQVLQQYDALLDCCAELPTYPKCSYAQNLSLDLIPLQANQLHHAVESLELLLNSKKSDEAQNILVFCALGYSRSSAVVAALLLKQHPEYSVEDVLRIIRHNRPWVVLKAPQIKHLNTYRLKLKGLAP